MTTRESVDEAREIVESLDEGGGMTIGFEKEEYVLTGEQMQKIARALYLADTTLSEEGY